jgi:hypothetical protein
MNIEGNFIIDAGLLIVGAVIWHFIHKGATAFSSGIKTAFATDILALQADVAGLKSKVTTVQTAVTHVASTAAVAATGGTTVAAAAVAAPPAIPAVAAIINPPLAA